MLQVVLAYMVTSSKFNLEKKTKLVLTPKTNLHLTSEYMYWFDLARSQRSSGSKLHVFANFERERERLELAYESLVISKNIMYQCWKWYLEMLLVRIGFCMTKSDIQQYWCFQFHGQMFKLTKHSFLNFIQIRSGSELFFFFKGERIQISLKVGHHRPASETPWNGLSLAQRWMLAW